MDRVATLRVLDQIIASNGAVVLFGDRRIATPGANWPSLLDELSREFAPVSMKRRWDNPAWERHEMILLRSAFPDVDVYCPIENYPDSLAFGEGKARQTFLGLMDRAANADVLVAYVPEASMGTAIEMWQAHRSGRLVVTVSPLATNWTVRFLSTVLLPDIGAFERYVESGEFARLLASRGIVARPEARDQPGA